MCRGSVFLLLAGVTAACGADTGDGLEAFGEAAEQAEEAYYTSYDHPSGDVRMHLAADGSFLLNFQPWSSATLRGQPESLEGVWRVDDGTLTLSIGRETLRYRQGPLRVEIPGWNGELHGLDFLDSSTRTFAEGFDLADDAELTDVMDQVLHGD